MFFYEKYNQTFQTLKDVLTSVPFLITPNWLHDFKLMCDVAVGAMKNDSILGHQLPPRSPIARPKTHAPLPEIIHLFHSSSKLNLCTSQSVPFPFSYVSHRLFVSHVVRPSFLWSSRVRHLYLPVNTHLSHQVDPSPLPVVCASCPSHCFFRADLARADFLKAGPVACPLF